MARIMSSVGMPSVMQTTSATPASAASMTASAAGGRRHEDDRRVRAGLAAPPPRTVLKIGQPSCVVPPLPGVTPPTMVVP